MFTPTPSGNPAANLPASETTQSATEASPLEKALQLLSTYDVGSSRGSLLPIDEAVTASLRDPLARSDLEQRLLPLLSADVRAVAKEYICRKLALIGSVESVAPLARLLRQPDLAESARSALEALPGEESVRALRASLADVSSLQKIGVIHSLGARRDPEAVRPLAALLTSSDASVAGAAAAALGNIGTVQAAEALQQHEATSPTPVRLPILDARLACAERLASTGEAIEARAIYKALSTAEYPKPVQLAAKRGLLLLMQKKQGS